MGLSVSLCTAEMLLLADELIIRKNKIGAEKYNIVYLSGIIFHVNIQVLDFCSTVTGTFENIE